MSASSEATVGVAFGLCKSGVQLITLIAKKISDIIHKPRELVFLFINISLADRRPIMIEWGPPT